jgi:hypothetical protein
MFWFTHILHQLLERDRMQYLHRQARTKLMKITWKPFCMHLSLLSLTGVILKCKCLPNVYTYRFLVNEQEITILWHLRLTVSISLETWWLLKIQFFLLNKNTDFLHLKNNQTGHIKEVTAEKTGLLHQVWYQIYSYIVHKYVF